MLDIIAQINAIHREVGTRPGDGGGDGEDVAVLLRRDYDASAEEVWDALTDPDRMKRWFLPVSGDLRAGGDFQLEGNAGGRILRCEPPRLLRVTFGGESSLVEVRLIPAGEGTTLELEHTVPLAMVGSGAGALYVGPGWDSALLALDLFVGGENGPDPLTVADSPEGREFSLRSVRAWTATVEASGTAGEADTAAAVEAALAQFAPEEGSTSS
ncbi:SRPBCC family protein [Streptosporangium sp. NPDC050855]|uniref:SRPBCC family protein n=1 Tax=Streptosporangium sp. NPDC050855 TaxID=3366194 RepID=UPI00378C72F2